MRSSQGRRERLVVAAGSDLRPGFIEMSLSSLEAGRTYAVSAVSTLHLDGGRPPLCAPVQYYPLCAASSISQAILTVWARLPPVRTCMQQGR